MQRLFLQKYEAHKCEDLHLRMLFTVAQFIRAKMLETLTVLPNWIGKMIYG